MKRIFPACVVSVLFASAVCADTFRDDFSGGAFDENRWCDCQIGPKERLTAGNTATGSKGTIIILAKARDVGGNRCAKPERKACANRAKQAFVSEIYDDETERLTASMFAQYARTTKKDTLRDILLSNKVTYCSELIQHAANFAEDGELVKDSDPPRNYCIQRQELRLHNIYRSPATQNSSYTIRFKMPSEDQVQDRVHSLRWAVAQWKHDSLSNSYENDPKFVGQSPFVAVRFDDAVLHVTVQDENVRCMIATAQHHLWGAMEPVNGPIPAEHCQWTGHDDYATDTPKHSLSLVHHSSPVLKNAAGEFTTLRLDVTAGKKGEVVLWQDDVKIATVTGRLGYKMKSPEAAEIKFKFGQYRDYMADNHDMEVDFVEITD